MKIIGIAGKAGAGKDTAADFLVECHGFVKRGFADPLYEEVASAFGVTVEWLRDRSRKELPQDELAIGCCDNSGFYFFMGAREHDPVLPRSPRWVLQQWGTEYRRGQNDQYWVERMDSFATLAGDWGKSGLVIPDVRFENEAIWVRANGGRLLHLARPGIVPVNVHESEAGVTMHGSDAILFNGGTLEGLRDRIAYEIARG